jgi:hypothetical protein
MGITQTLTTSFKLELLEGIHNFTTATFYMALYAPGAALDGTITAYTSSGEVTGSGYIAGGMLLTIVSGYPQINGIGAVVTFNPPTWTGATFTTAAGLIYNSSAQNRSVAVLNFGSPFAVTAGNLTINMPSADQYNAIVRIV